ncbi:Sua5/YciO/YrdC/YwlC family protein, partial [Escherichia coli]|uniref:Sua5/YciO/YrdC/YwlC family protein n=1 Tax=Escherichia coli TaxID=562 RepID=UPI003D89B632
HNFTLMCRDLSELSTYSFVDNVAFSFNEKQHAGQLYLHPEGDEGSATPSVAGKTQTIGMRVPSNPIAQALLEALGEPMLSTSLMLPGSEIYRIGPGRN